MRLNGAFYFVKGAFFVLTGNWNSNLSYTRSMIVTVTSLRLKSLWDFFKLSYRGLQIVRQTKGQKGFVTMKNTGFGYLHYTLSAWESEADLKEFAKTGAHLVAMKKSKEIANEISTYTFESSQLPSWKEAKSLLSEKGKTLKF